MNNSKNHNFDAIVVGSGITGGWAAKELTEAGLRVLMIERGRMVEHGKDYITEHQAPWDLKYRELGDRQLYESEYPIVSKKAIFNEYTRHFFANEKEMPYVRNQSRPFDWIRGNQLGGRSLMWARQVYRLSDLDFTANQKDGHGIDWPIRYADLEPWYDYVEDFIGVSGQAEGLAHLPDGKFLPPMAMNAVETHVRDSIADHFDDRVMTIGRVAVLTKAHRGRGPCHYCGPCERGCSSGSYFSTQSSTLPAARATGLLTVMTDTIVTSLEFDAKAGRATGVNIINTTSGTGSRLSARLIFLCASTLGTTHMLLNSRSDAAPHGLGNSSGTLGRYLMDHTVGLGAVGTLDGFDDHYYFGHRPNGIYVPRFRNVDNQHPEFLRGYALQGGALRQSWRRGRNTKGLGRDFKDTLTRPGPWNMALIGFGECLPYKNNRVVLDERKTDKWGIPLVNVEFSYGENEKRMRRDIAREARAILLAAGAKNIVATSAMDVGGAAIHEMGTARMGHDPSDSVVNKHNQLHDVPNVFVSDGACMTSSACQNPSLTYMAITARACNHAVTLFKEGKI